MGIANIKFNSPFDRTELELRRYPFRSDDLLQAWDSADELLLQHLSTSGASGGQLAEGDHDKVAVMPDRAQMWMDLRGQRILIANDSFGALTCALANCGAEITSYTDSFVAAKATRLNLARVKNIPASLKLISDLAELSGVYDLVLSRVPKNMSFFEDLLCRESEHLGSHSRVVCTAMVKHLPKTAFDLLNQLIGTTTTSFEKKKARLIFANFEKLPTRTPFPLQVNIEKFSEPFTHHSNLFSREKLDIGTRFFLEHLPVGNFQTILDLGCANGIVGIAVQKMNPQAKIIFTDESKMAIQSAQMNADRFSPSANHTFVWTNGYENQPKESVDLVLCNPPFHQQNIVGDFIAHQMFVDARNVLRAGGQLRVIGNVHLPYPGLLKKIFGNSKVIATNDKFMVVDSFQPRKE
jgi:23S rRNA (guanine1835-N2)-methyltransferase